MKIYVLVACDGDSDDCEKMKPGEITGIKSAVLRPAGDSYGDEDPELLVSLPDGWSEYRPGHGYGTEARCPACQEVGV